MEKKFLLLGLLIFNLLFIGCSSDDDAGPGSDSVFMEGALTSATSEQLQGAWSIVQLEYEGQRFQVPPTFPECGRDFFNYMSGGEYREYIFADNLNCIPNINMLGWSLSGGVITVTNGNASDTFVITKLSSSSFEFKARADIDGNGSLEIITFICIKYEPPMEIDIYSGTFQSDSSAANSDKIYLKWDKYRGYNEFQKYEIYRLGESCNSSQEELVATISDVNQNYFIDENPPAQQEICYVFKIYTNQGMIGESQPLTFQTENLEIPRVQLAEPVISNGTIQLNWQQYEGRYFSHYEIEVRNYSSGSGGGYQEETVATINSLTTTSYLDTDPPYFANPVYVVHVYNIFGYRNSYALEGLNQRRTNFVRPEILPFKTINFPVIDPTEPVIYFFAEGNVHRYNYATKTMEGTIFTNTSSIRSMQIVNTNEYGKELIVISSSVEAYNPANMQLKYELDTGFTFPDHLAVNENGYWIFTDRQDIYSYRRNGSNLTLINSVELYPQHFGSSTIGVKDIREGRILVGNFSTFSGKIVEIDANGLLSNELQTVPMNLTSAWLNNSLVSPQSKYVLNVEGNTMYSTTSYNLIRSFGEEFFPSGISNNGSLILGSKNNRINDSDEAFHEKKIRTLAYPSWNETVYESKGYPHFVFQNHLGQTVSISKGLVGTLNGYPPVNDIFVEIIQ